MQQAIRTALAATVLALAGALVLAGCSDLATDPTPLAPEAVLEQRAPAPGGQSVAEIVVASTQADAPEFTLLLAALGYIGETNPESALLEGLFNRDQYTVFAPTDAAFLDRVGLENLTFPRFWGDVVDVPASVER